MAADYAETSLVYYTFVSKTVMVGRYKPFTPHITTPFAEEIIMQRLEIQDGNAYHMLLDMTDIKIKMTKKARQTLMGPKGLQGLLSVAVLVNRKSEAWIARVLLKFTWFPIQVKVFYKRTAALSWLGGQRGELN